MDVEAVMAAERARAGEPDPVSGAFLRLALTQGTLLKEEYDHSTHFFAGGAVLGAAVVDTVGLIHLNMKYGFPAVDRALAAQVRAMKEVCPRAKVVRIHGDAFAVVLGPTADQPVEASLAPRLMAAVEAATRAALGHEGPVQVTVALLELTVKNPPNHDVLGPLLWGECERALVLAKRGQGGAGVLERRVDFDAAV
jgi:GGDEF domain-containing protein